MRRFAIGLAVFAMLAFAPRPAHAQSYFVPFYGFDFGGDAGNCPSVLNDCSVKRTAYGFAVGHLSHGILGFEEDFSYAPDFFGTSTSFGTNNSVLTLMSNLVVSIPAGPVHPYVSGGIGLMRTKVDLTLSSLLSTNNTSLGYNLGGGVMIFLPAHLGLRVDYRNLRSATNVTIAGITLEGPKLNFSRIAFGLVLH
jgi:opacity protein-like surface antigen